MGVSYWGWSVLAIVLAVCAALSVLVFTASHPRDTLPSETTFLQARKDHPGSHERREFASQEKPLKISVVVPAFNEESRITVMLSEAVEHLKRTVLGDSWEIIVVNDCSTDGTTKVALELSRVEDVCKSIKVTELVENRGKGGAIAHGMKFARGDYILFADADGASRFQDIELLSREIDGVKQADLGIAVGSRAHMVNTEAVVQRSYIRNLLMHGFHLFLRVLGIKDIEDTQCGFKLFTRDAAAKIFPNMHVQGWIFDIEILLLAGKLGIPVKEVPITWHEIPGSKINLIQDSIRMALDLLVIRLNYALGVWKIR